MATKPDFPALLPPGRHRMTLDELRALALTPFPTDAKRADLFGRLLAWRSQLAGVGISCSTWLDGSFLTEKVGPGDIDVVVWSPSVNRTLTAAEQVHAASLFDRSSCKVAYGLDLYLEMPAPDMQVHREAYWMGFLGFCHDRVTAKGFAEVVL